MTAKRVVLSLFIPLVCAAAAYGSGKADIRVNLGHTSIITDADMSPDGSLLATTGGDGMLRIWDCASFRELRSVEAPEGWPRVVRFSADGGRIAWSGRTSRSWISCGASHHPENGSKRNMETPHPPRIRRIIRNRSGRAKLSQIIGLYPVLNQPRPNLNFCLRY